MSEMFVGEEHEQRRSVILKRHTELISGSHHLFTFDPKDLKV